MTEVSIGECITGCISYIPFSVARPLAYTVLCALIGDYSRKKNISVSLRLYITALWDVFRCSLIGCVRVPKETAYFTCRVACTYASVCLYTLVVLIHSYIHTYLHTYLHAYIHTHMHAYIHTYLHTYMQTYIHTCIHTYIPTYIHANIHTHMHAYIDI